MAKAPTGDFEVVPVDPYDAAAFDDWFGVWRRIDFETWPEGPGWQYEELLAMARDKDGPVERRPLVARRAGTAVGVAGIEMFRLDNHHLAQFEVRVLPEHRRQGVGTALVEATERIAREAGRSELSGEDETPLRRGFVDTAAPFARHLGFTVAQRTVRRCFSLPLDEARVAALAQNPKARPVGYTLTTFVDRWPDESLDDRAELGRRMSTDMPAGEQHVEEQVWDAARVRALEASLADQNRAKVITAARHDASARMIGFTEVVIPLGAQESAWQHDTLVLREHRGHGLGFAMKVANMLAVQERYPAVRRISTWNAEENTPMIAVNDEIGCEVVSHSTTWHRRIGAPPAGSHEYA